MLTRTQVTRYALPVEVGRAYTFRVTATDNRGNFASAEVGMNVLRITKYYYAAGRRIAMRRDGVLTYLHGDHLGSASLATDELGGVVSETHAASLRSLGGLGQARYFPYGAMRPGLEGATSPRLFDEGRQSWK